MKKYLVEEVFVTEGVPEYTFVKPPNYNEILIDFRKPGKPVIIEGQSGTGKTCTARKVLEELIGGSGWQYLSARQASDVEKVVAIAESRPSGTYVIDDFHRLSAETKIKLADIAKLAAEQGAQTTMPKLVLIGINQIGASLINLVPDIAKRCGIHKISPGQKDTIQSLVQNGCRLLNVASIDSELIFSESQGDYWLSQNLCQVICVLNNILATQEVPVSPTTEISQLRATTVKRLQEAFGLAVKEFCRGKRFRPSNDPYYKLLKALSSQPSSIVDLNMLANSDDSVRGSINNIKERRLAILLDSKPVCANHFYYNTETKHFAIEDPALFYYLRHLDWEALRVECGFKKDIPATEYDVAISFAGENRDLARFISEKLVELDVSVFYDEYFESNFLGKTWGKELRRIFADASRNVVCILDKHHLDKLWPTFERDCFKPRVEDEAVIPIYLDDTVFPGIPTDLIGIKFHWDKNSDWQSAVIDDVVMKIIDHLD